ncbi:MAG TPA: hypothetical protein VNU97_19030 [Rhizomicrobium sp.]|jgi:hypothetical protein|nr:hypothetical protein [Rhizomicrobium sp.]
MLRRKAVHGLLALAGLIVVAGTAVRSAQAPQGLSETPQALSEGPSRIACPAQPLASSDFASAPAHYTPRYDTITHRLLDDEKVLGRVTPQMYLNLDTVIARSATELERLGPYRPNARTAEQDMAYGRAALHLIDCVLVESGFVYPGHGLVPLLSDGLGATAYADRSELLAQSHNRRRRTYIEQRATSNFYVVDCDIASFLYLAVAQVMHYPLHLVEIPGHDFVRWTVDERHRFDFDTMDGVDETVAGDLDVDSFYKTHGVPASSLSRGHTFADMTENQIVSYYYDAMGLEFLHAPAVDPDYAHMLAAFEQAIRYDRDNPAPYNRVAWFLAAVRPDAALNPKALAYSTRATALWPQASFWDTKACVEARRGDFDAATATQRIALNAPDPSFSRTLQEDMQTHLAAFANRQPCAEDLVRYRQDVCPFRPGTKASGPC